MISSLYIEEELLDAPRTQAVQQRFAPLQPIPCRHYGEIFNRRLQNFRLQKRQPALIVARKKGELLYPTPPSFGIGAPHNYYFSHILNCLYDCRYCFLQGMFRSAHYVWFSNYEDFINAVSAKAREHAPEKVTFFTGYDGDSLVLESITHFAHYLLDHIPSEPNLEIEFRTKSTQIEPFLQREPDSRIVIAASLNPQPIVKALENKTPPIAQRLRALAKLQKQGWPIGLRIDPLVDHHDFEKNYTELIDQIFTQLQPEKIHSITTGAFRLPTTYYKTMVNLYPEEALFYAGLEKNNDSISYRSERTEAMRQFILPQLQAKVDPEKIFWQS